MTNIFLSGIAFLAWRFGDPTGDRWVDRLNWLLRFRLPVASKSMIRTVVGQRGLQYIESWARYIVYERNPLTMILYLVLSVGGYVGFVYSCYPHLPNSTVPFMYHKELGFCVFCLSLFFFGQAASINPGIITKSNHSLMMKLYPFDGTIFKPNLTCSTCKVEKPARSKHCRYDGYEVAKFDHHCIWINQCVGIGNQRSFLLFLIFNNLMCLYGAYLGSGIFCDVVKTENLTEAWFRDSNSGNRFKATPYYIFIYLMGKRPLAFYLTVLCVIMGIFLIPFTWYHWVTLMRHGITTNEESKLNRVGGLDRLKFITMYSRGSWWRNLKSVFVGETYPPMFINSIKT